MPGHPLAGLPHVRFAANTPGSRARYHRIPDTKATGAPMTAPEHFGRAEELAAKASGYLGHGDGQDGAAVWAAVAQVRATLALAAATMLDPEGRQQAAAAAFQPGSPAAAVATA
jgi:hypothetical protein